MVWEVFSLDASLMYSLEPEECFSVDGHGGDVLEHSI